MTESTQGRPIPATGRVASWVDNNVIAVREIPITPPGAGEVLVRIRACGICGSDLKIQDDQHPYIPPVVIGHEFAGEIVEIGTRVTGWQAGDRIVSEQHVGACGRCRQCLTGDAFACSSKRWTR